MAVKSLVVSLLLSVGICCGPAVAEPSENPDPFESINRRIYAFNDFADRILLAPIARSYRAATPQFIDDGVSNIFANLGDINSAANNLLQLKIQAAASDCGRFLINSTAGLLGFFDLATAVGLEHNGADFGQTLAVWGADSGPYIVVPLLGPATIRSGIGSAVDTQFGWQAYVEHVPTRNTAFAMNRIDARADLLQAEELITGDRYIFIRDAFLQRRQFQATGEVADDFGGDDFDWEE